MFLILLVLIWFSLQFFFTDSVKKHIGFFCRPTLVKQITRSRSYQCEGEDRRGKGQDSNSAGMQ